jgi:type IV pilus assembly protein PilM
MMIKLISPPTSTGLERFSLGIKGASVVARRKKPFLVQLFTFRPEIDDVKQLYIHHPIITTGLEGKEVLIRSLHLPLTKEKDIQAALAFQAEPLLPYAADQAFLAYQILSKNQESTDLMLLAVRKVAVQAHIQSWEAFQVKPEKVACVPSALCEFGCFYLSSHKTYLILHLQNQGMTCALIKEGKLLASFAQPEGLELLLKAQVEGGLPSLPQSEMEWQALDQQKSGHLNIALKRLQKEIVKMGYALAKELKGDILEGVVVTGEAADWTGLSQVLVQNLHLPLLVCEPSTGYSSREILTYAVPIGLALGSLPGLSTSIDFRQQECSYPHPWRRLLKPVAAYFLAVFLLSLAFYFFGQQYLHYQEDQLRQTYVNLLADMHKSHQQFELAFLAKNSRAHEQFNDDIPRIEQIKQEDLMERLAFLQKELQATPDSFPLFANIPRVSDVLAWLSQHPAVMFLDEEGNSQTRLQIEDFSYIMLKRPQQGKKQEKYQVKIELEFSSPTPKWAREFHDALIAPNDWVDPKGEVKWNSNRGKYKTSFFLKDKTVYPNAS